MKFYRTTLEGMQTLLAECGQNKYADIISSFIEKWDASRNVSEFIRAFSKKGVFEEFRFNSGDFPSFCEYDWTNALFGALVAMAMRLAHFIRNGQSVDIDFIRSHFGHPTEIIEGTVCEKCGSRQINMGDVDKYIHASILARKIVDGLEDGNLSEKVKGIVTLTDPDIHREREKTKTRILNTPIPFSDEWMPRKFCLLCGGTELKKCKFLKSMKDNVFVPLKV